LGPPCQCDPSDRRKFRDRAGLRRCMLSLSLTLTLTLALTLTLTLERREAGEE
jgi:hypothetical protein